MLVALVAVHLQAVLVPLWVAMQCRGWWLKSGFVCFSLASLAEMVDHTTTDWVYVNHNSFFNGVFYGALATGLALLTAAVSSSRSWRLTLLLITTAALASSVYGWDHFSLYTPGTASPSISQGAGGILYRPGIRPLPV